MIAGQFGVDILGWMMVDLAGMERIFVSGWMDVSVSVSCMTALGCLLGFPLVLEFPSALSHWSC
mgnify:FL=1